MHNRAAAHIQAGWSLEHVGFVYNGAVESGIKHFSKTAQSEEKASQLVAAPHPPCCDRAAGGTLGKRGSGINYLTFSDFTILLAGRKSE